MIAIAHARKEWASASLEQVAANVPNAIVDGPFGSNLKLSDYEETGIPVLQGKNISHDLFRWVDVRYISERKAHELRRSSVRVGDILIVKIGSIGFTAILDDLHGFPFAIIPANLAKITPNPAVIDTRFLQHWLKSPEPKRYFTDTASRTAQPALSLEKIKRLRVPLPALDEQRRIASILDQAETLRATRREVIRKLERLGSAIFEHLFGDVSPDQNRWPVVPVSEFVAGFETGKNIASADEGTPGRYRVLKVSAVTSLTFRPEESKPTPLDYNPPASHFVQKGDLLFSRANTADLIGATALVSSNSENLLLPDKIWRFCWRQPLRAEPLFVLHLFRTEQVRRELSRRATGTSGSMKNISQAKVLSIRVGLPPPCVQEEFVKQMKCISQLHEIQLASLAKLDALFASLQHRAFRGEL